VCTLLTAHQFLTADREHADTPDDASRDASMALIHSKRSTMHCALSQPGQILFFFATTEDLNSVLSQVLHSFTIHSTISPDEHLQTDRGMLHVGHASPHTTTLPHRDNDLASSRGSDMGNNQGQDLSFSSDTKLNNRCRTKLNT
jgi:hypothetical protein